MTPIRKRWEVLERLLGDELILIADRLGEDRVYVVRQPAGRLVWKLLAEARTTTGLAALVARARGRASPLDADNQDVAAFHAELELAKLVTSAPATAGAVDPPADVAPLARADERPALEPVALEELLPDELVVQGVSFSGNIHGSNAGPGAACP